MTTKLPRVGRILAVDFGTVRVGLAVADWDYPIASPLATYTRVRDDIDRAYFIKTVEQERITGIIVGLPIHNSGKEGVKARESRDYADWLAKVTKLPIELVDERFTTVFAEEILWDAGFTHKQRKARRDALAAQILLKSYLESLPPAEKKSEESQDEG
ncbi:MAG: Holliday junction resolvase RuvX [Zavarzinella sp.]